MHNFLPPHSASLHLAFGYILWTFPCVNLINSFPRESFVLAFFEHFEHFWTFFNRMWEVSPLLLGSGRSDQLGREGCWAASEVCDPNNGAAGRWSRASLFGLWNSELGVWYVLICFDGFCSFFSRKTVWDNERYQKVLNWNVWGPKMHRRVQNTAIRPEIHKIKTTAQ